MDKSSNNFPYFFWHHCGLLPSKKGFFPKENGRSIREFANRNYIALPVLMDDPLTRAGSAEWWLPLGEGLSSKLETKIVRVD